ncbi:MAG: Cof-type HAD-IIB family hydrolase [Clostridiales bacterium]|nr:Cof-type HAD-IIB family hydrolase [Clostridiales bacterium]
MNQKIIFLDLDGTLLNDRKEITPGNRAAIDRALAAGHKVVIATGRPLVSAIQQAEKLSMTAPGCYLIAYNGGVLYDMGRREILFQETISLDLVRQVFAEANRRGLHIQTYNDRDVLIEPRCDGYAVRRYCDLIHMEYQVIPSVEAVTEEPVKMLLIDLEDRAPLEAFRDWVIDWSDGVLDSFFSSPYYLEIVRKGLNKGNAIRQMCALLDIPIENSCAVGDADNDLPMLRAAHVGAAMANATAEVKAAGNYITQRDNNHDGVAEVIERFLL